MTGSDDKTPDDRTADKRKQAEARRIASTRLHRFYKDLMSGFEADADAFFRRVIEQKEIRERGDGASRH